MLMKSLRSFARWIALVPWLSLAALAAESRPPNVILILADDMAWSDARFVGHPYAKTPNLDRFAQQSTWLRQFYVASPVCSPSRAAFLTSHFPARDSIHGHFDSHAQDVLRGMPDWLDPKIPTVAQLLHQAGYTTGVFGKWHLGGWHEGTENAPTPDAYGFDYVRTTHCRNPVWPAEVLRDFWPQSSRVLVDETLQFIKANKDRPFYAHLCLLLPHAPLNPTPEQVAVYQDLDPRADNPAFGKWMQQYAAGAPDLKGQMATYLATITDIDTHVGRLLTALDEMKLADNTIVLFTSDNGPEHYIVKEAVNAGMGDPGPFRGRKRSLYEGGIRMPALIRWPGRIAAGRVDDTSIVSSVDWLPTLCKLAGAKLPPDLQLDGEDVSDILLGRPRPRAKPLFWEWLFRAWGPEYAAPQLAMREGDWKFYIDHDGSHAELYNIFQDNTEERNVAAQHPELVQEMTAKMRAWVKTLPPSAVRDQVSQTGHAYYSPEVFIKPSNPLAGVAVPKDWYERSLFLLHLDYHPEERDAVGQAVDFEETARLLKLIKPDVIQMHAKGIPGWTTYPSGFGFTPPKLSRDILKVWSDLARTQGYVFNIYYCLGIDEEIAKRRPEWARQGADGKPLPGSFLCFNTDVGEQYLWPMIEEIQNRYKPSGWWFDNVPAPVRNCYCERCRARFRREYNLEAPTAPTQEGWAAFKEMHRQIYREFRDKTVALVHRLDPDCRVAVNWDCSFRMPEEPPAGIDHFTGDHGSKVDELVPDAIWYDSQGKPYDLMTANFYTDRHGRYLKPRLQVEQEIGIVLSHGGRFSLWDDPTREGGLMVDHCQFNASVVTPFLRARQAWCHDSQLVPDISIYHGVADHYAQGSGGAWVFPARNEAIYAAIAGARQLHLSPELISDRRLESGDVRSGLLLLEDTAAMTDANRAALRRFVEQGGRVLLTGKAIGISGLLPEGTAAATTLRRRPLGRGEVLSLARPLFPVSAGDTKSREQAAAAILDQVIPREARQMVAEASPDIDLVLRKRGSERILHLVNSAPGKRERDPESYPFLNLHVTELPPAPACRVSVRLAARPRSVMLQPQAQPLADWRWHDGWLEVNLPSFESHQMLVIGGDAAGDTPAVQ